MSTIDLSRQATDPRKHYAGVRMQQGRVLTDDDFNEAATIDAEELRRTRLHAIGAYGSPDGGFVPTDFGVVGGKLDFKLATGTLYLGGLRVEMAHPEHLLQQKDWLNFDTSGAALQPPAEGEGRTDLVWIEVWQQPVTAIEDRELFDVALGGPDTSTRMRTMRRVHVAHGVDGNECAEVWGEFAATFKQGTLSPQMELVTPARLKVTFTAPKYEGDLCSPPKSGGYLGAENQAIRVQMVGASHYTWGFDNAAPLYRVKLSSKGGALVKLTLLNQPRDAVHWPLKGQVVELLPWSAALPNGERVAEVAGHLCKVSVSYNPDDHTLEIDTPVLSTFGTNWKKRSDTDDFFDPKKQDDEFFYLRVWNRGDDLASLAAIPIAQGELGHTGLKVEFIGTPLRAADYWVIAARPASPDAVTPWRLTESKGAPPHGVRRWRAPLALVRWSTKGGTTIGKLVHDCRPPFLPLTRLRGCCSVTVGDGTHSFGMYDSIQKAVDALPENGGTVCVLPGVYEESVSIFERVNVTLHGCGPRSRIVAPAKEGENSSALRVQQCSDVVIESLALEGGSAAVVHITQSRAVRLESCLVHFRDQHELFSPWPGVFCEGQGFEILNNIVEVLPTHVVMKDAKKSAKAAGSVELDRVFHPLAEAVRGQLAQAARGGIQLAGGTEYACIAGNVIVGGAGNGITLGSISRIDAQHPDGTDQPDIDIDTENLCAPCLAVDISAPTNDPTRAVRYESGGDLYRIEIRDNVIARHGTNGIGVVRFFDFAAGDIVLVMVNGLRITGNRIQGCMRKAVALPDSAVRLLLGYGGISLAAVQGLEIDGNVIQRNGRDWLMPICGVFVLSAEGLRIEHNLIRDNGPRSDDALEGAQPGIRAGVHVWLASDMPELSGKLTPGKPPTSYDAAVLSGQHLEGGLSQLRVHGNQIEQPLGRALFMLGLGTMAITDNRLASAGAGVPATDRFASTALIANLGVSREWNRGLLMTLAYILRLKRSGKAKGANSAELQALICYMARYSARLPGMWLPLPTGKLMFNDNQVSFVMPDAGQGIEASSVLLFSLDDVSACDNQFEYHTERLFVMADLLAMGVSVRTNSNRFSESWGRAVRSLASAALMNTAADNQSTHCLATLGPMHAVDHNLVLAQAFCEEACGSSESTLGTILAGAAKVAWLYR